MCCICNPLLHIVWCKLRLMIIWFSGRLSARSIWTVRPAQNVQEFVEKCSTNRKPWCHLQTSHYPRCIYIHFSNDNINTYNQCIQSRAAHVLARDTNTGIFAPTCWRSPTKRGASNEWSQISTYHQWENWPPSSSVILKRSLIGKYERGSQATKKPLSTRSISGRLCNSHPRRMKIQRLLEKWSSY